MPRPHFGRAVSGSHSALRGPDRTTLALAALILVSALAPPLASAHQLKSALTTVELNERTALVEIVHRFWVHDAEHAVEALGGVAGDLRGDEALQALFARYVTGHFVLAADDREVLALQEVGVEVEGPYVWVYQELPAEDFARIAWLRFDALQELWGDQINQLNVKRPGGVRSVRARAGDRWLPVPAAD